MFIQTKSLFQNTTPLPTVNAFNKTMVPIKNFGLGLYSINHSSLNKTLFNKFFTNFYKKNKKHTLKLSAFMQSYDIKSLHKLHTLGLLLPSLNYGNMFYAVSSQKNSQTYNSLSLTTTLLYIITKISILIRLICTRTLLNTFVKPVHTKNTRKTPLNI